MTVKRITTTLVVVIEDDWFDEEYDSDAGRVLYWALEHGDGSGDFASNWIGEVKIEDIEENV